MNNYNIKENSVVTAELLLEQYNVSLDNKEELLNIVNYINKNNIKVISQIDKIYHFNRSMLTYNKINYNKKLSSEYTNSIDGKIDIKKIYKKDMSQYKLLSSDDEIFIFNLLNYGKDIILDILISIPNMIDYINLFKESIQLKNRTVCSIFNVNQNLYSFNKESNATYIEFVNELFFTLNTYKIELNKYYGKELNTLELFEYTLLKKNIKLFLKDNFRITLKFLYRFSMHIKNSINKNKYENKLKEYYKKFPLYLKTYKSIHVEIMNAITSNKVLSNEELKLKLLEIDTSGQYFNIYKEIIELKFIYNIKNSKFNTSEKDFMKFLDVIITGYDICKTMEEYIVESNQRLVIKAATKYKNSNEYYSMDLVQEGSIGLLNAINLYEVSLGNRFSTYATQWIHQAIGRYFQHDKVVSLPSNLEDSIRNINKYISNYINEHGIDPSLNEIIEHFSDKYTENIIKKCISLQNRINTYSIESSTDEEDNENASYLLDKISTERSLSNIDNIEKEDSITYMNSIITKELSSVNKEIYNQYCAGLTVEEIALEMNVSRQRIAQRLENIKVSIKSIEKKSKLFTKLYYNEI